MSADRHSFQQQMGGKVKNTAVFESRRFSFIRIAHQVFRGVLLSADGLQLGGKGKGREQVGWTLTPGIVSWPGVIPQGTRFDGMMCTFDFYPTMLAAANLPFPEHLDGVDVMPYLAAKKKGDVRDYIYWYNKGSDNRTRNLQAVRWGNWRLYRTLPEDPWRLYDLKKDPREENDVAEKFPEIVKQVPEAKLLIVGDGPQRPRLEGIITEFNLQEQVIITGFEAYETMPQYINLATICINTFLTTEATRDIFPGKTVQFLACGKPLVATALPGMVAVIPGEQQGVVYASTIDDMVGEIASLLKSAERRQQIGQAGLSYVKQVHSHEVIARRLEACLEEAIRGRGIKS